MSNSRSWGFDVIKTTEPKLEWITSPQRGMFVSRASILASLNQAGSQARIWKNLATVWPLKKPATTGGGRKRLATEKQRFYVIGRSVDQMFPRLESAFRLLKELRITSANSDLNTLKNELLKRKINHQEVDAVLQAKTPMSAAKRFVAKSLTSLGHPNGISLQTINSCYSRYLKALKSKPPRL